MRRARLLILRGACFALAACEPAERSSAPTPAPAAPAVQPRQDLPEDVRALDLFGAWIVEAILPGPTVPAELGWEMVLLVGSRQLELLSQCVTIGPFAYGRRDHDGIVVSQPEPPVRIAGASPVQPPPRCTRMLSPAEQVAPRILLTADRVTRRPDGALLLSGQAGSLVLRRPAAALANPRGQQPPPQRPPLIGAWRFLRVNGRDLPPNEGMELLLRPPVIEWRSGCVNEVRTVSQDGERLLPGAVDPYPVCERGRDEAELAVGKLTSGPIDTRMQRNGRLSLSGSGVTAELVPLT